jgi:hypothetical protein
MGNNFIFSLGNLTSTPNFDFIHSLRNISRNEEHSSSDFFESNDDNFNFDCKYLDVPETCNRLKNDKRLSTYIAIKHSKFVCKI